MLSGQQIDRAAYSIIADLQKAGFAAYLVGGAVRDMLLDIVPKDYDISTNATPEEIKKIFGRSARIIGRRFKIVHVYRGSNLYELSTFRRNPTEEERKARETDDGKMVWRDNTWGTIEEDAMRRDFTANALYLDPLKENEILDFCGGVADIQNKIVRCLGEPDVRFEEDPVRMLRALKLVAQYDFHLEESIETSIKANCEKIGLVSQRRLYEELLKITYKPYSVKTWLSCERTHLLESLFPGLDFMLGTVDREKQVGLIMDRDIRVAQGGTVSRTYGLAVLCYRFVEMNLNPDSQFGEGWNYEEGINHRCRKAITRFFSPYIVTKQISARLVDVLNLVNRMNTSDKLSTKVIKNGEYAYAHLLYQSLGETLEWDEEKKEFWPDSERRVGRHHDGSARPTRKGGPKSRRRTRRPKRSEGSDRSGPSRKPKKSED